MDEEGGLSHCQSVALGKLKQAILPLINPLPHLGLGLTVSLATVNGVKLQVRKFNELQDKPD